MKPQQIRDMLAQTLEDRRLSRGERSALNQILGHLEPGEQRLANYRSMAFDLARDVIDAANASLVLDWLEDVVKLLQQPSARDAPTVSAEAFFSLLQPKRRLSATDQRIASTSETQRRHLRLYHHRRSAVVSHSRCPSPQGEGPHHYGR